MSAEGMHERIDAAWNSPEPSRSARALYRVAWAVLRTFCALWFRISYEGRERIPTSGPFILAPVHRSNLDTPIVAGVTHRTMRFMGKDGLWKANRAFSWFISALGAFPVSRAVADRDALRRCQTVLEAGQPLVLYPEGTRKSGPLVEDCFDGPAFLSLRTGAPIVPVGIGGSERAQAKGEKWVRPTKVWVVIGEPIVPKRPEAGRATSRRAVKELTDQVRDEVQRLFDDAQARTGRPNP